MHSRKVISTFAPLLAFLLVPCLTAQQAPASFGGSVARSATPPVSTNAASRTLSPSAQILIQNRARVYGDRVSANGTQYFYVSDSSLRGKTPDEILKSLSPAPTAPSSRVRDIQSVVNLSHPLTLYVERDQSINIGTAIVQGAALKNIEAHSSIVMPHLTILPK